VSRCTPSTCSALPSRPSTTPPTITHKARWHFHIDRSDYLAESDGHQWFLTAQASPEPADVTITATTGSLAALIVAGSDHGVDITGDPAHVQRFRRLISTMSAVAGSGAHAAST
jgi:hypothetical protein